MPADSSLKGKAVLVTGAGDGIGRGIAMAFAEAGASVAICDIRAFELEATRRLVEKTGVNTFAACFDIRDAAAVDAFISNAARALGRIDVLVNNAGVMPVCPIEQITEATIDLILGVNLKAAVLLSKAVIPHMRKSGGGSILHMSSVTGHNGYPGVAVYGATKGALMALARGQAMELACDKIRVNTVSPGAVNSPMMHRFITENASDPASAREAFDRMHPRGKIASVEEVAAVFVFLASDVAVNITATDIRCDGGLCVQGQQPRS